MTSITTIPSNTGYTLEACVNDARIVRSIYGKKLLKKRGCRLFAAIQKLKKSFCDNDFKIVHFVVVKSATGYQKGDIILDHKEAERVLAEGGRVRDIYTYRKEVRKALRSIADILDIPTEWQHGFHKNRGTMTAWQEIKEAGEYRYLIDLENAFCQITRGQLYEVLKLAFDLNKADSLWFSKMMCDKSGHLFQGNPISPAIFNLLSARIGQILHSNIAQLRLVQYADDLTICSNEPLTPKVRAHIKRLISYTGWKVNIKKLHYVRKGQKTVALGITQDKDGNIRATGKRRMSRLVRWINHIRFKAKEKTRDSKTEPLSKRTAKDGKPIRLVMVKEGLLAWLLGCSRINFSHTHTKAPPSKNIIPQKPAEVDINSSLPLILKYELGIITRKS